MSSHYVSQSPIPHFWGFIPHTQITMHDHTFKRISAIKPGDYVIDPDKYHTHDEKSNSFRVISIIRYEADSNVDVIRFGQTGLTIFYPIRTEKDNFENWVRANSLSDGQADSTRVLYNLVLDTGHQIHLYDSRMSACTMAHQFEGPVVSHSYFGKKVPGRPHCLIDLGTDEYINCENLKQSNDPLDVKGEFIKLTRYY